MPESFDRSTESEAGRAYRRESFWLDSVDESLDPLPPLDEELRADVAIVGAGFTGLWTAYFLKQNAPDLDIVIVEKEIAGFERQLAPIHSRMIATAPLDDALRAEIGLTRRRSFACSGHGYGQLTADGRIAFGARGDYYFGSRIRNDFGPETADSRSVRALLLEAIPALREVEVTHGWGGAMGFARDEKPFVFLDAKRRVGWAGGHGPAGVAPSCMAGETLSDLVLGLDTPRVEEPWVVSALPPAWEPEPLRWLGINGVKTWREWSPF